MSDPRQPISFTDPGEVGRLGSLSVTLGAGSIVQLAAVTAGIVTLPLLVSSLGPQAFGVLIVIVSGAPILDLVPSSLYSAMRLLVGEARADGPPVASRALVQSGVRSSLLVSVGIGVVAAVSLIILPVGALVGSSGSVGHGQLILSIACFAVPSILAGPGWVFLGAIEGVGRTVAATVFAGIGPVVALPMIVVATHFRAGLPFLCAILGVSTAVPRLVAWAYWRWRPSWNPVSDRSGARLRASLVMHMMLLSATVLIQTGLDPVIVSSNLGADEAGAFGIANRVVTGALIPLSILTPLFMAGLAAARGSGWSRARDRALRRLLTKATLVGFMLGACVVAFGPIVGRVLSAGRIDPPFAIYLAGGAFVLTTYAQTPLYLAFSGPRGLSRSVRLNIVLVMANLSLSLALVRTVGASGPLWASAAASAVAVGYWLSAWKRHPEWLTEVHVNTGSPSI